MFNAEETANLHTLIEDLCVDLRNGNIPAATKLITTLADSLSRKQPIESKRFAAFILDHLDEVDTRAVLLHLLPIFKDDFLPLQPNPGTVF